MSVRVAVVPIDALGHVNPLLAIVARLSARDDVDVLSLGPPALARPFAAAGARHIAVGAAPTAAHRGQPVSGFARRFFIQPLETIEKYVRCCESFRPDVVLYDVFSVQGFVAARYLGVPSASLVTFPGYGAYGDELVERHAGPHPSLTAANGRYRDLFGVDVLGEGRLPVLFPSPDLSIVTAVESLSRPVDADRTPLLFSALSKHAMAQEFVGACVDGRSRADVWNPRGSTAFPFAVLDEARRAGRRIVLFSLGTVLTDSRIHTAVGGAPTGREFLRAVLGRLIDALGEDPELLVVAAIGTLLAEDEEPDWPGNFVACESVPQLTLLDGYADAFITHHGTNSTAESILAGVPMVSLPGIGDQITNAEIAIGRGAAVARWDLRDPFTTCDADLLGRAVRAALHEESYRTACTVLRAEMLAAGGADRAARLVVELAGGTGTIR